MHPTHICGFELSNTVNWCMLVWCIQNIHWNDSSFMWHQPGNNQKIKTTTTTKQHCKHITSVDIENVLCKATLSFNCLQLEYNIQKQRTVLDSCSYEAIRIYLRSDIQQVLIWATFKRWKLKCDILVKFEVWWWSNYFFLSVLYQHNSLQKQWLEDTLGATC